MEYTVDVPFRDFTKVGFDPNPFVKDLCIYH